MSAPIPSTITALKNRNSPLDPTIDLTSIEISKNAYRLRNNIPSLLPFESPGFLTKVDSKGVKMFENSGCSDWRTRVIAMHHKRISALPESPETDGRMIFKTEFFHPGA